MGYNVYLCARYNWKCRFTFKKCYGRTCPHFVYTKDTLQYVNVARRSMHMIQKCLKKHILQSYKFGTCNVEIIKKKENNKNIHRL